MKKNILSNKKIQFQFAPYDGKVYSTLLLFYARDLIYVYVKPRI